MTENKDVINEDMVTFYWMSGNLLEFLKKRERVVVIRLVFKQLAMAVKPKGDRLLDVLDHLPKHHGAVPGVALYIQVRVLCQPEPVGAEDRGLGVDVDGPDVLESGIEGGGNGIRTIRT